MTNGGFEVEKIEQKGMGFENVVVGQIKTIVNHAEADKLSVCKVDIGKKQLLTIVCGAKNIKPLQRVPVALIGARLPSGIAIERRRIRGVESEGMLCAPDELGLGTDRSGILILDKDLRIGQNLGRALELDDVVLDITVTANRPDGLSVVGLAREFAALSGQKFIEPKIKLVETKKYSVKKLLSVSVQNPDLCPKYTARVVKNVKIQASPAWLQSRLRVMGVQPINNIVDITNYVMLEMGQPLHAFDAARIVNKKIVVRTAKAHEKFMTLDGVERDLTAEILMIADSKQSLAIAGVMGGQNSEITRSTKDVVIESAIFKPICIRRTRQKLGIITEASMRFEKGIWWDLPEIACDRAAQLMSEIAGGEVAKDMIIVSKAKESKPATVTVTLNYINKLIGRNFTAVEVKNILEQMSFTVSAAKGAFKVTAPKWRTDISLPADIVEEIGRVYGWNNLKPVPIYGELKPMTLSPEKYWERKIKDTLVACGMTEVLNYSFYGRSLLEMFGYKASDHYRVDNPLNPEQEYLRISLLPRLYENLLKNYQAWGSVKLFEVGRVFIKTNKEMPDERVRLAGLVYTKAKSQYAPFEIKSILKTLILQLGVDVSAMRFVKKKDDLIQFSIIIGEEAIGYGGVLPFNAQKLGSTPVWFEINMDKFIQQAVLQRKYEAISDFPGIERDMTFVVNGGVVDYALLAETIKKIDPLVVAVEPVDLYKQSGDIRNLTVRISYQSQDRTLKSEEVEAVEKRIIAEVGKMFKAEIKR